MQENRIGIHFILRQFKRREEEKNFMEMEERSYSDFYRNTSEELFIKTMMEGSIGMPAPTMEMLGFKNLSINFRTDSEELFKSWLTNGEASSSNIFLCRLCIVILDLKL